MFESRKAKFTLSAVIGALVCVGSPLAIAADVVLEEIVVTATKRETRAQETPVPLTVFSEGMLERANTAAVTDLETQAPSMQFGNDNSDYKVKIRGIGSDNITLNSKQGVALHQDGVYMARPSSFGAALYDVQRVEVVRGPQGTLYGRNATGGAINVISNPPTNEFEARADFLYGNYDRTRERAVFNVPLVDEKLAFRLTASKEDRDGYQENRYPGGTQGDDADTLYLRGQLLWTLSEDASITARANHYKSRGVGPVRNSLPTALSQPAFPNDLRLTYKNQAEHNYTDQSLFALEGNFGMSWAQATALVNYSTYDIDILQDTDASLNPFPVPPNGETSTLGFVQSAKQFSTELRLSSVSDGRFRWLAGLFYYDENADEVGDIVVNQIVFNPVVVPPGLRPATLRAFGRTEVNNTSYAAFTDLSYKVTDTLTATVGARYTRDEGEGSDVQTQISTGFPFCFTPFPCVLPTATYPKKTWSKSTWKAGLDWQVAPDHLLYAVASTGFRSGGFNVSDASETYYDPEDLRAFELGSKNTFAGGRARLNVSAFYYDYKDQQIQQIVDFADLTENSESEVYGAELEFGLQALEQLEIEGHVSYLHGTHEAFLSQDPGRPGGPDGSRLTPDLFNLAGNELANTPRFSGHLGATYTVPLVRLKGDVVFRVQSYAQEDMYLRAFNLPVDQQDGYTKSDAYVTFNSYGNWFLTGGVSNIEDEDVVAGVEVSPAGRFHANLRPPRTWFVSVGVNF